MTEHTLELGNNHATIALDGGVITSFAIDGCDVLRRQIDGTFPTDAAYFPCIPYFGRLYNGLDFRGKSWKNLSATLPEASALPLHGHGWISKWTIIEESSTHISISHIHDGTITDAFPFPYNARQTFALTRSGLSVTLAITNSGSEPMPAGIGLHPFFPRREETRVRFSAAAFWFPPTPETPGILGPVPGPLGSGDRAVLPAQHLDHSFSGFDGSVLIEQADKSITLQSSAPALHIYAPSDADFFCLEPITQLPGTLTDTENRPSGAQLEPDETLTLSMTIATKIH